jgi:NAD/NADP transhydrogenase alpha subunit
MLIGITTETKAYEKRVAVTPDVTAQLLKAGFEVCIQAGAGMNSYFSDDRYTAAGGRLESDASKIYQTADVILKVNADNDEHKERIIAKSRCFCAEKKKLLIL